MKKSIFVICNVLLVILVTFSALVCTSILWMFDTWPNLTMQELMFQIQSPINGTNKDIIIDYMISCIFITLIILILSIAAVIIFRKRKKVYYPLVICILFVSILFDASVVHMTWQRLDIDEYAKNSDTYSSFVDTYYADPSEVELTFPEEKKNLIYIFLESMEITYTDEKSGGAFENNFIPELTNLAVENEDFSGVSDELNGGTALKYGTWTAAALFSQTSGLPLTLPIDGNSMDTQESFLPAVTALGDILEQQGYNQTFMIGSDGEFGGRSLYFSDHGNYNIKDYYYFQSLGKFPSDYWVWWGIEDEKLFEYAKEELVDLASQKEPFNFTMLTVDTHFEDGYVCEECESEYGDNQYANVLSCSSRQVNEFIEWIQAQDFYENTTIVISGDHATMDSDFCENIDDDYERKVYTVYINSSVQPEDSEWRREYSTFDNFPTTLASLGVDIQGNRLGLGTNLFSTEETLTELYGVEYVNEELMKKSELMDELTADIDEDNVELRIREGTAPTALATAMPYDYTTGVLSVVISDFQNTEDGISGITAAVWTEEDQSDLQWVQAEVQSDGTYMANVNVPNFGFATGIYYVDVYLTDDTGNQFLAASTTGYVE